jgi:hypothetical protein
MAVRVILFRNACVFLTATQRLSLGVSPTIIASTIVLAVVVVVVVSFSQFRENTSTDSRSLLETETGKVTLAIASRIWIVERKTALMAVFASSYRRSLLGSGLVCFAFLLMTAHTSAQDSKTRTTIAGSSVSVFTYKEIPAATGPCTSEECDWWNRLREAGNKLLRKGDEKSKNVFATLFVEGIVKSYRAPSDDRPSQVLFSRPVQIADLPLKPNGTVRLSVEFREDGSIGDVNLLDGLRSDVDKRCIREARNVLFLPAVRDRKFVTEWKTPQYKFFNARN